MSIINMERVDSKALNILSMYSDSDEEDLPSGQQKKRRSTGEKAEFIVGTKDEDADQLPDAPESFAGSQRSSTSRKSSWSDGERSSRSPREPPPPARPDYLQSPSPTSQCVTPTVVSSLKMSRIDSQQALVAYLPDEDDLDESHDHRRRSLAQPPAVISDLDTFENLAYPTKFADNSSAPNSVKSSEPADDLDSYTLLEKTLDNRNKLQDSPQIDGEIELPPESSKRCPPELEAKFKKYFAQKANGYDFNKVIQSRKDFRNPSMYEKLVEHCGIDELGTNFAKDLFDPHGFRQSDFYEDLSKSQRLLMEKIEKDKQPPKDGSTTDDKKRKSKWDNPSGGAQATQGLHAARLQTTIKADSSSNAGSGGKKLKG